ncbi:unnamed protein product [Durusdinium trenchii]|uniref:Centromere protein J C-terminal domain-containing protein n=1 Tax=Durusdinium trenchii TaxID=1381693 RepID=A0ABP0KD72_9DINO
MSADKFEVMWPGGLGSGAGASAGAFTGSPLDDLHLQLDAEEEEDTAEFSDLEGEPPTSDIVRSYFHRAVSSTAPAARPSPHWEGSNAFETLYGRAPGSAGKSSAAPSTRREGQRVSESEPSPSNVDQAEVKARLQALDAELKKYEKENETLKKLQAHAKQAERDLAREREKLWKEVEAERTSLHAEFDVERAAMRKERRRLAENADRQRQQLREEREAAEERQRLTEHSKQLEEEMREKEKRWQRTVDRLQRQVTELSRKNGELQEEVQRLNQQAAQTQQASWLKEVAAVKRGISARRRTSSLGPAVAAAGPAASTPGRASATGREVIEASAPCAADIERPSKQMPVSEARKSFDEKTDKAPQNEVRETRNLDGRVERIFVDGRREVEFSNGLKKIMWPDGQTSVLFQNGDLKEIRPDGVVVYHYRATGAVQTTLNDGTELYQFSDGQTECHSLDGSKEIRCLAKFQIL